MRERVRTTDGCAKLFVRIFGHRVEENVLGLSAHRRRDSIESHVFVLDGWGPRNGMRNLALPDEVCIVRL